MYPSNYTQANILTTAQFAQYCPEVDISGYTDSTVSGIISQATEWIFAACEVPTLLQSTIISEESKGAITASGDLVLYPLVRPIQTVQAIRLVKGGFSTSLTIYGSGQQPFFQMPTPKNKIVYPSSYLAGQGTLMIGGSQQLISLRGAGVDTQIDYTAGISIPVTDFKLIRACVLVCRAIFVERYNPMGADSLHQGNVSISWHNGEPIFYEIAMEILDKGGYHRVAPRV